jgi:hypothetical protein
MLGIIARAPELLTMLNSPAHKDFEIEGEVEVESKTGEVERPRKQLYKPYTPPKKYWK